MYSIRTLGVVFGIGALAVVGAGPGTASAGATPHTLRLTAAPLGELQSSNHDVTAGSDTHNGKATGFDASTCVVNVTTHRASCDVAVARVHGLIYAHATVSLSTGQGRGRVTGGTRAYKGATGTVTLAPGSAPKTIQVTLVFHT